MVAPFQSHIIALESPTLATSKVFECVRRTAINAVLPEMSLFLRNISTSRWSTLTISSWRIFFIAFTVKLSNRFIDFVALTGQLLWFDREEIKEVVEGDAEQTEESSDFSLTDKGTWLAIFSQFSLLDSSKISLMRFDIPSYISFSA